MKYEEVLKDKQGQRFTGVIKKAAEQWTPKKYKNYNKPFSISADIFGKGYPRYAYPPENVSYTVPGRQITFSGKSNQIRNNYLFPEETVSVPMWFPRSSIYLEDLLSELPGKSPNGQITKERRKSYRQALDEYKKSLKHMEQNVDKSDQLNNDILLEEFAKPVPSISKAN